MLTFDDLIVPAKRTVKIRGKDRELRFVSGADMAVVDAFLPHADPPMIDDPNGGSLAPKVPNTKDPAWRKGCEVTVKRQRVAGAAIALRYTTRAGLVWKDLPGDKDTVAQNGAYVVAAEAELGALLSEDEVTAIRNEMESFTVGELAADAVKN